MKADTIRQTVDANQGYLLLHFTSYDPNCGYCIPSNPYTDELAKQHLTTLKVARIHWEPWTDYADHAKEIKQLFRIRGIPKFMLYKDGQLIWEGYGHTTKNLNNLQVQLKLCCP